MKTIVEVSGMSCGHCVKHVNNALEELGDAKNIQVSLENGTATFDSDAPVGDERIKAVIEDAGYEVGRIERK